MTMRRPRPRVDNFIKELVEPEAPRGWPITLDVQAGSVIAMNAIGDGWYQVIFDTVPYEPNPSLGYHVIWYATVPMQARSKGYQSWWSGINSPDGPDVRVFLPGWNAWPVTTTYNVGPDLTVKGGWADGRNHDRRFNWCMELKVI